MSKRKKLTEYKRRPTRMGTPVEKGSYDIEMTVLGKTKRLHKRSKDYKKLSKEEKAAFNARVANRKKEIKEDKQRTTSQKAIEKRVNWVERRKPGKKYRRKHRKGGPVKSFSKKYPGMGQ